MKGREDWMATINLERRSQIGQARREKTRRQILEAAFRVFAERGYEAPTTDDLVAEAGVARGTFYGYFETKEEIMRCVARVFVDSIEAGFATLLNGIADPGERVALRIRFLCEKSVASPSWGWLIIRSVPTGPLGTRSRQAFLHDIASGLESGQFEVPSVQAALDLVQGAVIMGVRTMLVDSSLSSVHVDDILSSILRGLGASARRTLTLCRKSRAAYRAAEPKLN